MEPQHVNATDFETVEQVFNIIDRLRRDVSSNASHVTASRINHLVCV